MKLRERLIYRLGGVPEDQYYEMRDHFMTLGAEMAGVQARLQEIEEQDREASMTVLDVDDYLPPKDNPFYESPLHTTLRHAEVREDEFTVMRMGVEVIRDRARNPNTKAILNRAVHVLKTLSQLRD